MENSEHSIHKSSHNGHVAFMVLGFLIGSLLGYMYGNQSSMTIQSETNLYSPANIITRLKNAANKAAPKTVATPTNMITYTSTSSGFSLQYPNGWTATSNTSIVSDGGGPVVTFDFKSSATAKTADFSVQYNDTFAHFAHQYADPSAMTLDQYVADQVKAKILSDVVHVTVGGQDSISAIYGGIVANYTIYTMKNGHVYTFSLPNVAQRSQLSDTSKQIISSIKFL